MTPKQLKKLKNKLPFNGMRIISDRTGYSYVYVSMVLLGSRNNQKIIDTAIDVAREHQEREKERIEKINAL